MPRHPPGRKPPERTQVSVRTRTYERLRAAASSSGEQVGTLTESIIVKYLDEQERNRGKN